MRLSLWAGNTELTFKVRDTDIAQRWAQEVAKNYPLYETDRFQGWPTDKDIKWYKEQLQHQVDVIFEHRGYPRLEVTTIDQNTLNYLHKIFETVRGEINTGTDIYMTGDANFQYAVDRLNILVHECEHFMRNTAYPSIVVTFKDRPRIPLLEEDYNHFTFAWEYGAVYINYCEVGKPILDVIKDGDDLVGEDNIRPLEYYSSDFMVKLGPSTNSDDWHKKAEVVSKWLQNHPRKFKHTSLGLIPVADLDPVQFFDLSKIEPKVTRVCIV